jgi:ABC-type Fe3+ transport system substrate-binding protein
MTKTTRSRRIRTAICGAALAAIAAIGSTPAHAQTAGKLRLVSPHPAAIQNEFTAGFKQWMRTKYAQQTELEWLDQGGTSNIMRFILSEFKRAPQGINVDLFFGGGTDSYIQLSRENLLETYRVPDETLRHVAKDLSGIPVYDPQHRWYGVALAGFGIMYNALLQTRLKLPAAKTWQDLTHPALQGRIATADPRNSGSAHMVYEIILQAHGWEKGWQILTEMGGNVKAFTTGASDVPQEVALGNVVYGPVIDFYAYAQIVKTGANRLVYVTPEGLSVINPDSIAILKGAPNRVLAQRFVEYCLTKDAQRLWMLPQGDPQGPKTAVLARASVIPALYDELGKRSVVPENPFRVKNTIRYDWEKSSKRWSLVNDLYGALIIDAHRELVSAWQVVSKTADKKRREALGRMPVTEAEATSLAASWDESSYALTRKQKVSEWRALAARKYADARSGR